MPPLVTSTYLGGGVLVHSVGISRPALSVMCVGVGGGREGGREGEVVWVVLCERVRVRATFSPMPLVLLSMASAGVKPEQPERLRRLRPAAV